jgi:hypothetical protein
MRELLMTAARSIKTPVMTLPLRPGAARADAEALASRLRRLRLAEARAASWLTLPYPTMAKTGLTRGSQGVCRVATARCPLRKQPSTAPLSPSLHAPAPGRGARCLPAGQGLAGACPRALTAALTAGHGFVWPGCQCASGLRLPCWGMALQSRARRRHGCALPYPGAGGPGGGGAAGGGEPRAGVRPRARVHRAPALRAAARLPARGRADLWRGARPASRPAWQSCVAWLAPWLSLAWLSPVVVRAATPVLVQSMTGSKPALSLPGGWRAVKRVSRSAESCAHLTRPAACDKSAQAGCWPAALP